MLCFDWLGLSGTSWAPIGLCWFGLWRQKLLPQARLCGASKWGKGVSMKKNTFCTWATCYCWIPPPRAAWPVCVGEGILRTMVTKKLPGWITCSRGIPLAEDSLAIQYLSVGKGISRTTEQRGLFPGFIVIPSGEEQRAMILCHLIWTRRPLYSLLC